MNVIQANARSKFTSADVDFILAVLAPQQDASQSLVALFSDEVSRDLILDNEALFHVLLDKPDVTNVSPHFYFYVLVRHVLRKAGIEDREVADYVAEMLATFSSSESVFHARSCPMQSLVDMLAALQEADETGRFNIQSHIANTSLFLSGLFKRHCCRRRRAAPGIDYYEQIGSANFRLAGDHR
ncbi:MAG: hypothetical protein HY343_09495, partial [Lentisphaerae bacterium]|nr:hypothetical protein [Lentisphaerota bacterium]